MNKLLERQLNRYKICLSDQPEDIQKLLGDIGKSYDHYETDRSILERSADLSSRELTEVNKKLRQEAQSQKVVLENLKTAILSLPDTVENLFQVDKIGHENLISISNFLANQIQKRKEAEDKLKLYERAILSSNNGIIITDSLRPDDPIIYVNPAFTFMTGFTPEEVLGKNCRFMHGDDRLQAGLDDLRKAIKEKRPCTVRIRNYKKNGRMFWNEFSISPIFNNEGILTNFVGIQNDVTFYVFVEEQLQESTTRLTELIKNIASAILVEDENRIIVVTNEEFCRIFKIPIAPNDLVGVDCSNAAEQSKYLLEDPENFVVRIEQILKEKKVVKNDELKFVDGSIFERDYVPIFTDGVYKGHLWNYREVTERKKNELNLIHERHLLKTIIDNIPDPIYVKNINGEKIVANKAEIQILGATDDKEVIGSCDADFYLPEVASKTKIEDEQVIQTGIPVLNREGFVISQQGETKWFIGNKVPFSDLNGNIIGLVGISHNITERKKIEAELINLKAFYEQTLHDLSGQVAVFDTNFRYLYVNPSAVSNPELRLWLLGKDDYDFCEYRNVDKSVADQRRKWLVEAKRNKKLLRFEEEYIKRDGSVKYFERKISPILDSNGEVTRLVAYGIDITEIKSLIKNLEYSNKSLTDFAYIASHDLREPLRKISAFGSLLYKSLKGSLSEDNQENLDYMIDGAKRMQQMVDDLLYFSRITRKADSYTRIDLDEVVHQIVNFDLSELILENKAKIIIKNKLGFFLGERTQIKQLFQNLIGNGIKYRRMIEEPEICISSTRNQSGIKVEIEDNGIGIEEKYLDQIFEMFKRLHSKEEYEGSGIGLAICKKIVELYNGEIQVQSKFGIGSKFSIYLSGQLN